MTNGEMIDSTLRVGVIGAGVRAAACFRNIPADLAPSVRLTAIADPNETNRDKFAALFAPLTPGGRPTGYAQGADLLDREDLDAVVIASPNDKHMPDAIAAMSRRIAILLEKPVATNVEDLTTLWAAHEGLDPGRTAVGFVLRYTPFYSRVREIIRSGRLGEILSIDADENLGTALTKLYFRGWRRDNARSGGFMVEKCCHDFDILSWLTGRSVSRVFSMSGRVHLRERPESERLARFDSVSAYLDLDFGDREAAEALADHVQYSPYAPGTDTPDHQVATLEFEDGSHATFTACMSQPLTNRRLRVFGSEGMLEGDIDANRIVVKRAHAEGGGHDTEVLTVEINQSGHHGGDAVLGDTFWNLAAGRDRVSRAGLREGVEAVLTAIAVQRSASTGDPVRVSELRRQVFGSESPTP